MGNAFEGRNVVVTGASSGIGRACALELSRQGARLLLVGRDQPRLEATRDALQNPEDARLLQMDLLEVDSIAGRLQEALADFGAVYGSCLSAGELGLNPLRTMKMAHTLDLFKVNYFSCLEVVKTLTSRKLSGDDGGAHVLIASVAASAGSPGQVGYCGTKGALLASCRAMALELAPRQIRVNTVSPGFVYSEMNEVGRSRLSQAQVEAIVAHHPLGPGQPEDVARAVTFLLDPANAWITGTDFVVDGGYTAH